MDSDRPPTQGRDETYKSIKQNADKTRLKAANRCDKNFAVEVILALYTIRTDTGSC
jgi:hypothetical protein